MGTAVRAQRLSESAYASTLAREFNLLEPEDAMKWEALRPDPQSFDFSQADRIVDFAIAHGMKVRGHTLVWHRQNPSWLAEGHYTAEQLTQILEKHIKTVVGHYRGRVFAWDVINEAFDEPVLGRLRSTLWYDQPGIGSAQKGTAYIERCFRWAHEADPEALLFYNEAEAETMNPKSDAVYAMVQDFRRRGVPLDGIGFEMHIGKLNPDIASIGPTSAASLPWESRCTSQNWMYRFRWSQRRSNARGSETPGCGLPPDCHRLSLSPRVHGDPDLGLHGQVFVDRLAFTRKAGRWPTL